MRLSRMAARPIMCRSLKKMTCPPRSSWITVDSTDDHTHGQQPSSPSTGGYYRNRYILPSFA